MSSVNVYIRENSAPSPGKHLDCPATGSTQHLGIQGAAG